MHLWRISKQILSAEVTDLLAISESVELYNHAPITFM
jgi:hypothetical protein